MIASGEVGDNSFPLSASSASSSLSAAAPVHKTHKYSFLQRFANLCKRLLKLASNCYNLACHCQFVTQTIPH